MRYLLFLMLCFVITLIYCFRLDEYYGLSKNNISINFHRYDIKNNNTYIYYLKGKTKPKLNNYFDTIPILVNGDQKIFSFPDSYGENGFLFLYFNKGKNLGCGFF